MKKNLLVSVFAVLLVCVLFMGFSNGPRKESERKGHVNNNTVTYGVPLTSPVFMTTFGPESFESTTFPPAGWTRFSAVANIIAWDRALNGTLPSGWNPGFGLEVTVPPGGGTAVALATYDATGPTVNDIWLVTPKIYNVNTSDSLVFWLSKKADFADRLDVKISKTVNNNAAAFSINAITYNFGANGNDSVWTRKAIHLGSVAGINNGDSIYVGFREFVANNFSDGGIIMIDLVAGVGSLVVGTGNNNTLVADRFGLAQNYPNPFNPSTTINYNMPKSGHVKITVFDVLGNEIATIVNENKIAGTHQISFNAGNLASGIYFYKMQAADFTEVKRMTLIK